MKQAVTFASSLLFEYNKLETVIVNAQSIEIKSTSVCTRPTQCKPTCITLALFLRFSVQIFMQNCRIPESDDWLPSLLDDKCFEELDTCLPRKCASCYYFYFSFILSG